MLLHEIGHALGLRHPKLQRGGDDAFSVRSQDVSYANTIMAYADLFGKYGQHPTSLQYFDILALVELYGENPNGVNAGDTIYDFSTVASRKGYHTIYDTGGIDTLDFSDDSSSVAGVKIDLTPGWSSAIERGLGFTNLADTEWHIEPDFSYPIPDSEDFSIGPNTIIERVIGTNKSDTILGNDADNFFEGRGGKDKLDGRGGIDTASYENSAKGIFADLSNQPSLEPPTSDGITISVKEDSKPAGDTLVNIENLIGSKHDDVLIGNLDHNRLDGGRGGDDTLTGGGGKDVFVVELGKGKGHDTITDFQRGIDKIILRVKEEWSDLLKAFQAGEVKVRKPDIHKFEIYVAEAPDADYVTIDFLDSISEIDSFREALGGDEFIQTEVV